MKYLTILSVVLLALPAAADLIPAERDEVTAPEAEAVKAKLVALGATETESSQMASRLSREEVLFLAAHPAANAAVGALLPEEWIGSALWFYLMMPRVERNFRRYIINDRDADPWFDWNPIDSMKEIK